MSDDYQYGSPGVADAVDVAHRSASLTRLWVTPANPETEALKSCADALDQLDPDACGRVLDYLTARFAPGTAPDMPRVCCWLCTWHATGPNADQLAAALKDHLRDDHPDKAVILEHRETNTP